MGFFMMKNEIFELGLSPIEFCVLCYLKRCGTNCFPSRANIAKHCNISIRTVDKAISGLVDKGLVSKEQRFMVVRDEVKQMSNFYVVNI